MHDTRSAVVGHVVVLAHHERLLPVGEELEHGLVLEPHQLRPLYDFQLCVVRTRGQLAGGRRDKVEQIQVPEVRQINSTKKREPRRQPSTAVGRQKKVQVTGSKAFLRSSDILRPKERPPAPASSWLVAVEFMHLSLGYHRTNPDRDKTSRTTARGGRENRENKESSESG